MAEFYAEMLQVKVYNVTKCDGKSGARRTNTSRELEFIIESIISEISSNFTVQ